MASRNPRAFGNVARAVILAFILAQAGAAIWSLTIFVQHGLYLTAALWVGFAVSALVSVLLYRDRGRSAFGLTPKLTAAWGRVASAFSVPLMMLMLASAQPSVLHASFLVVLAAALVWCFVPGALLALRDAMTIRPVRR